METYRCGEPRSDLALRIGVFRRRNREDNPDIWLPALSPSVKLSSRFRNKQIPYPKFAAAYRAEMKSFEPCQLIILLALLSQKMPVSLGCHCEDGARCHRKILKRLIENTAEKLSSLIPASRHEGSSPVCYMEEL